MILPMIKYLEGFGVQFHYNVKVENVDFKIGGGMGPVRSHTGTGQDTILKKQAESACSYAIRIVRQPRKWLRAST